VTSQNYEQSRAISAPLVDVWRLHTDVEAWQIWNSNVLDATVDGPVAARSTVTMTTVEGRWRIRVYAVTENELVFWGDVVDDGTRWLQTWAFQETARGVCVAVTTSVLGPAAAARAAVAGHLHTVVHTQLDHLQLCAELNATRRS
jgi:hypothetical protein